MATSTSNISIPANTWVDVYTAAGIAAGTQIYIQLISSQSDLPARVSVGATAVSGAYNIIMPGGWFSTDSGDAGCFLQCPTACQINVRTQPVASQGFAGSILPTPIGYVQTSAALTNAEQFALRGYLYHATFDLTVASGSQTYVSLDVSSGRTVQIINRQLSSNLSGASFALMEGTVATVASTVTPYSPTGSSQVSTSVFNVLNTPTTAGTAFDIPIFIGAGSGGVGNAQAGTVSGETGYSIREGASSTYGRVSNLASSSNRIILRITYAEFPS